MKPIWIPAAILAATIVFVGCKNRKEEPVPAPNAAWATAASKSPADDASNKAVDTRSQHDAGARHGANGISWFQGTLEEGFSTTSLRCPWMFRH
jgi:hypothetical protein